MARVRYEDFADLYDVDNHGNRSARLHRARRGDGSPRGRTERITLTKRRPADGSESFKCGHCKAFIGPTVSGGRHRNHCPLCLYSRHVDDRTPGDRASGCRSLMAPIGTFFRPKGEQAILHRCLGCGLERYNRVAADDNDLTCLRLPLVPPMTADGGRRTADGESREAA